MKENKFRNNETAKDIVKFVNTLKLAKSYDISKNEEVENHTNKVIAFSVNDYNTAIELSKSMNLQLDFESALTRCEVWLDNDNVVMYVGACFNVYTNIGGKKHEKELKELTQLFNDSIDEKYNERKRKNITITKLTETKHKFSDIDTFKRFLTLFDTCLSAYTKDKKVTETKQATKDKKASTKEIKEQESKKA